MWRCALWSDKNIPHCWIAAELWTVLDLHCQTILQPPVPITVEVDDLFACSGSLSKSCADACLGKGRRSHTGLWHRCLRHSRCWSAGRAPGPDVQVLLPLTLSSVISRSHAFKLFTGLMVVYHFVRRYIGRFCTTKQEAHKHVTTVALMFRVDLPGGPLQIEWREADNHVYMTGPALPVFAGSIELQ